VPIGLLLCACSGQAACTVPTRENATSSDGQSPLVDSALTTAIGRIRAIDNHTHVNSAAPGDSESDALPLDALLPLDLPVRLRPDAPEWLAAYRALYGYPHADLSEAHLTELRGTMQRVARELGEKFPEWVLDRIGTETMLANRVAMGPGLAPPRFLWVSYVDALLFPLSNKAEAAATPDRAKLYPLEEKLLRRYLDDLRVAQLPATLDGYVRTVVTPTLERQRQAGAVAVKFEAAYLRSLDFDAISPDAAGRVYARYVRGANHPPPTTRPFRISSFVTLRAKRAASASRCTFIRSKAPVRSSGRPAPIRCCWSRCSTTRRCVVRTSSSYMEEASSPPMRVRCSGSRTCMPTSPP